MKENMQNIKAHTNLLYIFVMNQADLTSSTHASFLAAAGTDPDNLGLA